MIEEIILIKYARWNHWREALTNLLVNLGGSLMPIWLSVVLLVYFKQWLGMPQLIGNGELAIYSASFLTASIYLMFKTPKKKKNHIILSCFALVLSATLFTGAKCRHLLQPLVNSDQTFLIRFSFVLFAYAILTFFLTNFRENIRTDTHTISKIQNETLTSLDDDFEKIQQGEA